MWLRCSIRSSPHSPNERVRGPQPIICSPFDERTSTGISKKAPRQPNRRRAAIPRTTLKTDPVINLILETKGFDDLAEVKSGAAQRWVAAVNADGQFGSWRFEMARAMPKVRALLDEFL